MAIVFRARGHFETIAPNDTNITLNSKSPRVPQVHITTTHDLQISLSFTLHLALFKVQTILRQATE